jgi:hypothetical protein
MRMAGAQMIIEVETSIVEFFWEGSETKAVKIPNSISSTTGIQNPDGHR